MPVPATYLCTSPYDADSIVGHELSASMIIAGLRRINPNIVVPLPEHYDHYYPLKHAGITCLWLGRPGEGKKITAFKLGPVPEFSQLDSNGMLICKGWRAVFEKVIKARAATKLQIERMFNVNLSTDSGDQSCIECRKQGKIRKALINNRCKSCEKQRELDIALARFRANIFDRVAEQTKPNYGRIYSK